MVQSQCKGGIFQAREGLRGVDRVRNHMRMKDGSELEGHFARQRKGGKLKGGEVSKQESDSDSGVVSSADGP